jgi:hypothetical protein
VKIRQAEVMHEGMRVLTTITVNSWSTVQTWLRKLSKESTQKGFTNRKSICMSCFAMPGSEVKSVLLWKSTDMTRRANLPKERAIEKLASFCHEKSVVDCKRDTHSCQTIDQRHEEM